MLKQLVLLSAILAVTLPAQCPERNLGSSLGGGDDALSTIKPIGFAFPFAGTTYTDVYVCTNGFLYLSNGGVPAPGTADYTSTPAELANQTPRICPLWNDLNLIAANGASMYIDSAPTRCTITWDRAVNYGHTTQFQVQCQLFPSGEILMFWSPGATNDSASNFAAGSGVVGVSPGGVVNVPPASDLSVLGTTSDDTLFEQWTTQNTFDLPLQSLLMLPTNPGWTWIPTPQSGCANSIDYGTGCITVADSFYEYMSPGTFDLGGTTLTFIRTAGGYTVTNALAGTIVAPSGSAAVIANADDTTQTVILGAAMPVPGGTTTQLTVGSNGNIALSGTGNGNAFGPDVGNFLAFTETCLAPAFHDYNPALAGSGSIKFEVTATTAYVTWDGVYSYGSTAPDRFQCQFDLATGDITVVYDTFTNGSSSYLVGFSVGGASARPEATDLSVPMTSPLTIADVGAQGATLTTNSQPWLGNSQFAYQASHLPNLVPLGVLFLGDLPLPGIDLTFLGLPGCRAYTNASLPALSFPVALPAGTGSLALPIPGTASLAGITLTAQVVGFTLATPGNLLTSNGNQITLGL